MKNLSCKYLEENDNPFSNPMALAITTAVGLFSGAINKQKELNIYKDCGKRPFFIGNRRNEWDKCAKPFQEAAAAKEAEDNKNMPGATLSPAISFFQENTTPVLIGGAILGSIIIYSIFKNKK